MLRDTIDKWGGCGTGGKSARPSSFPMMDYFSPVRRAFSCDSRILSIEFLQEARWLREGSEGRPCDGCAPQLFGADAYQSIARLASAQCDVIA